MTFLALLGHIAGLLAPAFAVAVMLWILMLRRGARTSGWGARAGLWALMGVGVLVLLAGLLYFGRDGKMATYTALVLAQGSMAWWLRRR
jgi:hypothetical protein